MDQEMEGDKSSMLGSRELDARPSRRGDRRLHFTSALESPIYIAHFFARSDSISLLSLFSLDRPVPYIRSVCLVALVPLSAHLPVPVSFHPPHPLVTCSVGLVYLSCDLLVVFYYV